MPLIVSPLDGSIKLDRAAERGSVLALDKLLVAALFQKTRTICDILNAGYFLSIRCTSPVLFEVCGRGTLTTCVMCDFSFERRVSSMELQVQQAPNLRERANRISSFLRVQLIALIGWIIVQSIFFVTPISDSLPFIIKMVIETIWWIATLVIMYLLFKRIYDRFVKAVVDLEDANKRLRQATSELLQGMVRPDEQEQS